jgi:hypothetical protein
MLRHIARLAGEIAVVWLAAAATAASFLPRSVTLNAQDQLQLAAPSTLGALLFALPATGLCVGLWWLLTRDYHLPLAVASAALLVAVVLLPGGLTLFFLPPPLILLAAAWILHWAPAGGGGDGPAPQTATQRARGGKA